MLQVLAVLTDRTHPERGPPGSDPAFPSPVSSRTACAVQRPTAGCLAADGTQEGSSELRQDKGASLSLLNAPFQPLQAAVASQVPDLGRSS